MKVRFLMGLTCLPTTPPIPTTHFTPPYLPSLAGSLICSYPWPAIPHFLFSFLSNTPLYHLLILSHRYLLTTIFTIIFFGNVTRKSLRTSKHLHLLFEVKVSNLFGGFICFCLRLFLSKL